MTISKRIFHILPTFPREPTAASSQSDRLWVPGLFIESTFLIVVWTSAAGTDESLPKPPSHPLQPSLLSAEPLLPPHSFHSHSLRRLPLYQPLHISSPMPVSLSVGQPTLPPLPVHHRVPAAGASASPTQVPPFLSLPRRQPSHRLDQVGFIAFVFIATFRFAINDINLFTVYSWGLKEVIHIYFYQKNHSMRPSQTSYTLRINAKALSKSLVTILRINKMETRAPSHLLSRIQSASFPATSPRLQEHAALCGGSSLGWAGRSKSLLPEALMMGPQLQMSPSWGDSQTCCLSGSYWESAADEICEL